MISEMLLNLRFLVIFVEYFLKVKKQQQFCEHLAILIQVICFNEYLEIIFAPYSVVENSHT
jgi:hypothetical protein